MSLLESTNFCYNNTRIYFSPEFRAWTEQGNGYFLWESSQVKHSPCLLKGKTAVETNQKQTFSSGPLSSCSNWTWGRLQYFSAHLIRFPVVMAWQVNIKNTDYNCTKNVIEIIFIILVTTATHPSTQRFTSTQCMKHLLWLYRK